MNEVFPFTAVVGQQALKTALLLAVIDPRLGGVLISGARGSAKSTLVRSLSALMGDGKLVTLPLGASEEMVTGSINLQAALADDTVTFSPGLLARAHEGLLYVDEVNLLPDPLVDLLLDVSASGIHRVERDGISHEHPARFVLIGTMNPDEGELRPQLLDRFGLMAPVQTDFSIDERKCIVAGRLAHDDDPAAHARQHGDAMQLLRDQLDQARTILSEVSMPDTIAGAIASCCQEASVEGLRADITLHRASRAHAALHARQQVKAADLDAVAELVLAHRRHDKPAAASPPAGGSSGSGNGHGGSPQAGKGGGSGSSITGAWGAMPATRVLSSEPIATDSAETTADIAPRKPALTRQALGDLQADRRGQFASPRSRHRSVDTLNRPDWFRTLIDRDNRFNARQQRPRTRLHRQRQGQASERMDLVLLDTSASTFGGQGLAKAKGVIRHLARTAYLGRHPLSLITFGNDRIDRVLSAQRAPKDIASLLDELDGGGGTPFSEALCVVNQRLHQWRHQYSDIRVYILSDGRVPHWPESLAIKPASLTWIDTESVRVPLGRGRALAQLLGASYWHVNTLTESSGQVPSQTDQPHRLPA